MNILLTASHYLIGYLIVCPTEWLSDIIFIIFISISMAFLCFLAAVYARRQGRCGDAA